jgi:hypothetical protein
VVQYRNWRHYLGVRDRCHDLHLGEDEVVGLGDDVDQPLRESSKCASLPHTTKAINSSLPAKRKATGKSAACKGTKSPAKKGVACKGRKALPWSSSQSSSSSSSESSSASHKVMIHLVKSMNGRDKFPALTKLMDKTDSHLFENGITEYVRGKIVSESEKNMSIRERLEE